MELKIEKQTAKKLYPEAPGWFQKVLIETFGEKFFKKDFRDIKTFSDACEELGLDPDDVVGHLVLNDEITYRKLKVIAKAINQGWLPDWNNTNQYKWFPYFKLSSGFGFGYSIYYSTHTTTYVGSRLCFESEEKASYAGKQFTDLYKDFLTITK